MTRQAIIEGCCNRSNLIHSNLSTRKENVLQKNKKKLFIKYAELLSVKHVSTNFIFAAKAEYSNRKTNVARTFVIGHFNINPYFYQRQQLQIGHSYQLVFFFEHQKLSVNVGMKARKQEIEKKSINLIICLTLWQMRSLQCRRFVGTSIARA